MTYKWQKISLNHRIEHVNPKNDECYFLMVYTPRAGYDTSEANSRIYNFKAREKNANNLEHLRHIERRRLDFANDLEPAIESLAKSNPAGTASLIFIPTSKRPDHPDYNNGFEIVCEHLKKIFGQKIVIETPVEIIESRESSSTAGGRRDRRYIEELKSNLKWLGLEYEPDTLIIFDDVITTGAHFRALKELIVANSARPPQVIGLFWALSQKPADSD